MELVSESVLMGVEPTKNVSGLFMRFFGGKKVKTNLTRILSVAEAQADTKLQLAFRVRPFTGR